jgi:hypothetical protein
LRLRAALSNIPGTVAVEWWEGGRTRLPEDFPISEDLRESLRGWYSVWAYVWSVNKGGALSDRQLDQKLLDEQALPIWLRLRQELAGLYHVTYVSHLLEEEFEDPNLLMQQLQQTSYK